MLGDDLIFPQTISPKMTRCETDQHPRPRTDESDDEEEAIGQQDLWSTVVPKLESQPVSPAASAPGLWGGYCAYTATTGPPAPPRRTGLETPAAERADPFDICATPGRKTPGGSRTPGGAKTPRRRIYGGMNLLPLTPQRTNEDDNFMSAIDKKLQLERQIEEEFPDAVITQIYNYLSLGYPAVACMFDGELAKISRVPVEDLRKDDEHVDAKGYVGAPEGDGVGAGGRGDGVRSIEEGGCRRWEALRLYVREWARQSPGFVKSGEDEGWKRKGWVR